MKRRIETRAGLIGLAALALGTSLWLARTGSDAAPLLGLDARAPGAPRQSSEPELAPPRLDAPDPAPEREPESARAEPAPGDSRAEERASAPAALSLSLVHGALRDRTGHPLVEDGARTSYVNFLDAGGRRFRVRVEAGRYSIAGLPAGEWIARASAEHYEAQERSLLLADDSIEQLDFELEPSRGGPIAVRFETREGLDLLEAITGPLNIMWSRSLHAIATAEPPRESLSMTSGFAHDRFGVGHWTTPESARLLEGFHGLLVVEAAPPVYVSAVFRDIVLQTRRIEQREERLVFQIEPEQLRAQLSGLRLRVVEAASGAPLAGVRVALDTSQSGVPGQPTDDNGELTLSGRLPGRMRLGVSAPEGLCAYRALVDLPAGEVLDLGNIALEPAVPLALRFVDSAGRPVRVVVQLALFDPDELESLVDIWSWRQWLTDEKGELLGGDLGPGLWLVRIGEQSFPGSGVEDGAWSAPAFLLDTRAGRSARHTIQLASTTRVRLLGNESVSDVLFFVLGADRLPCLHGRIRASGPTILRLAPGDYSLLLREEGRTLRELGFRVSSEEADIDLSR